MTKMEGVVDATSPIAYAEFQIFPSQNRYEACVCSGNKVETLASGILEPLLLHLPDVKRLCLERSNASFKFQPPDDLNGAKWFTKSTLTRFLRIIGSPNLFGVTNAIGKEISQLEEARKFHLSLYSKDNQIDLASRVTDSSDSNRMVTTPNGEDIVSSDPTKNELLRAMDLRLTASRGELADAFNRATGNTCSPEEMIYLKKLSQHLGAIDLGNFFCQLLECNPDNQNDTANDSKSLFIDGETNEKQRQTDGSTQISRSSQSITPVKYGVSPAKVAQVERQSPSESEESSCSSEEDRPTVERSRALIRSASPRRSASPMRRIQIGRSGSRRAPALTIKTLNYFPGRDKVVSDRDASTDSGEEEEPKQPSKKSENNAKRMSVQDAINLFESKQRDQKVDTQKTRSLLNDSVTANKGVLRRWSAGMGESSAQHNPDFTEPSVPLTSDSIDDGEIHRSSPEVRPESESISGSQSPIVTDERDIKSDLENKGSVSEGMQMDTSVNLQEECSEKLITSVEWSRQREAELNQLMMKMTLSKPGRYQNASAENEKAQGAPPEQKGGFYNHYKMKRDEKLRGETACKRAEKDAQIRAMKQILNERKAEMASKNAGDAGRRKQQKSQKNLSQSANLKMETSKPAIVKKASSKAQSLQSKRKPWPSTPSPRTGVTPQGKTSSVSNSAGTTSAGTTPTRQKPQAASSLSRSSPKVERSQPRPKTVKATQNNDNVIKGLDEKKKQAMAKNVKTAKSIVHTTVDKSSTKPNLRSRITKKSTVVPLETKNFLRKGCGTGSSASSATIKAKVSTQCEESLGNSVVTMQVEEIEIVTNTSDLVLQQQEKDPAAPKLHDDLESEAVIKSPQKCEDTKSSNQGTNNGEDSFKKMVDAAFATDVEKESTISPTAWVEEIEEHQDQPIPHDDITYQTASPSNIPPRVRHSLSQMLLEETSEPDIVEWGNAENPPAIFYQKDAPKGLKRLLKFARKSKADANLAGWSSPCTFSDGEDDADECKTFGKTNAENLSKRTAFNAKNYGQQKTATSSEVYSKSSAPRELSAQSNISKVTLSSSYKLKESHMSATTSTTKATRSFFSLSAFRGSKPNETKRRLS